jgi:hypothetical protein
MDENKSWEFGSLIIESDGEINYYPDTYGYKCPHCQSDRDLIFICFFGDYIIFTCQSCLIGFKHKDMEGAYAPQKKAKLEERFPKKHLF